MATVDPLQTFVGPRILVKFAGAWEQTHAYEYMTAVYDTAYQSWVSKCDVPANTPLAEGKYWVKWSDPNAQFQLLQQTVQTFDQRITSNEQSVGELETNVETIETELATKHKMLVFGDSWSNYDSTDKPYWHEYVSDFYDLDSSVYAVAGAGFLTGTTITNQIANAVSTEQNKAIIDKIFIMVGVNDYSQTLTNLQNVIETCIQSLQSSFEKAEIVLIQNGNNAVYGSVVTQNTWTNAAKNACMNKSIRFINLSHLILDNVDYENSNSHPSSEGGQALAYALLNGEGPQYNQLSSWRTTILQSVDSEEFTLSQLNGNISGDGFVSVIGQITNSGSSTLNEHYIRLGANFDYFTCLLFYRNTNNYVAGCGYALMKNPYNALCTVPSTDYDPSKNVYVYLTGKLSGK